MKKFLFFVALIAIAGYIERGPILGAFGYGKPPTGVYVGATVAEVEKVYGAPIRVLPNFGRELRQYHTPDGKTCTLMFQDGKVDEIHLDE